MAGQNRLRARLGLPQDADLGQRPCHGLEAFVQALMGQGPNGELVNGMTVVNEMGLSPAEYVMIPRSMMMENRFYGPNAPPGATDIPQFDFSCGGNDRGTHLGFVARIGAHGWTPGELAFVGNAAAARPEHADGARAAAFRTYLQQLSAAGNEFAIFQNINDDNVGMQFANAGCRTNHHTICKEDQAIRDFIYLNRPIVSAQVGAAAPSVEAINLALACRLVLVITGCVGTEYVFCPTPEIDNAQAAAAFAANPVDGQAAPPAMRNVGPQDVDQATLDAVLAQLTAARLLCHAAAIAFWSTGHHIGQGELASAVKQVLIQTRFIQPGINLTAASRSAIYKGVHPVNSPLYAVMWGIGCAVAPFDMRLGTPAVQVPDSGYALRCQSNPMGTAKVFNVMEAAANLTGRTLGHCIPQVETLEEVYRLLGPAQAQPWRFHRGGGVWRKCLEHLNIVEQSWPVTVLDIPNGSLDAASYVAKGYLILSGNDGAAAGNRLAGAADADGGGGGTLGRSPALRSLAANVQDPAFVAMFNGIRAAARRGVQGPTLDFLMDAMGLSGAVEESMMIANTVPARLRGTVMELLKLASRYSYVTCPQAQRMVIAQEFVADPNDTPAEAAALQAAIGRIRRLFERVIA